MNTINSNGFRLVPTSLALYKPPSAPCTIKPLSVANQPSQSAIQSVSHSVQSTSSAIRSVIHSVSQSVSQSFSLAVWQSDKRPSGHRTISLSTVTVYCLRDTLGLEPGPHLNCNCVGLKGPMPGPDPSTVPGPGQACIFGHKHMSMCAPLRQKRGKHSRQKR